MRFTDLFRRDKAEQPTQGEAGKDGDSWYASVLGGGPDVNPELSGSEKFRVYDEMMKTSAAVKSLVMMVTLPVRSGAWGLNPATDEPEAKVIRDASNWQFGIEEEEGQLDLSWDECNQQGLKMVGFGPMFEELIWPDPRKGLVSWRDADGDEHLVLPLKRLAPRYPASVQDVKFDDDGQLKSVTQWIPGASPIPGDKVSYLIFEREGGHWSGVSMLRPAWGPWSILKHLQVATGIGWDRFAFGLPIGYAPKNPSDQTRMQEILSDLRGHERGYASFPTAGVTEQGKPMSEWAIELLNGAATLADPTPLLHYFGDQIAAAGLQQAMSLGRTQSGSRALGEVQIDPFFLAVQAIANYLRRERQRQVIRRFVRVNFGAEAAQRWTPKLTVSKIQARSVDVTSKAIGILAGAGFHFDDREAQDDVREMLGLTKLPNDLEAKGISRERLVGILRGMGLDSATFAQIVNALPPELGVARNRVPSEGNGLPVA